MVVAGIITVYQLHVFNNQTYEVQSHKRYSLEEAAEIYKRLESSNKIQEVLNQLKDAELYDDKYNYYKRYPFLLECKLDYHNTVNKSNNPNIEYLPSANSNLHDIRLVRAAIIYFPLYHENPYIRELQWFYRSWIEIQKYEPSMWRTDLVVFLMVKQTKKHTLN